MTSTYSRRALACLREHRQEIVDILLDLSGAGSGSRLSRLSGIRLELEQLLQMPVDVAYEGLLKHPVSESARRQTIAL